LSSRPVDDRAIALQRQHVADLDAVTAAPGLSETIEPRPAESTPP
jgi:hypothetical protein